MIDALKKYLQEKLKEELPGRTAHIEVAPYRKLNFTNEEIAAARKSGVLILLYLRNEEVYTVLMQRNVYDGKHSGQVSFPGGKKEKFDKDIVQTALREANEEIGIMHEDVEVVGQISNVFIPVSNFYVSPVLGIINYQPHFIPDRREVSELIELRLLDLLSGSNLKRTKIKMTNETFLKTPAFILGDKVVWGATALILNELKHILKDHYA